MYISAGTLYRSARKLCAIIGDPRPCHSRCGSDRARAARLQTPAMLFRAAIPGVRAAARFTTEVPKASKFKDFVQCAPERRRDSRCSAALTLPIIESLQAGAQRSPDLPKRLKTSKTSSNCLHQPELPRNVGPCNSLTTARNPSPSTPARQAPEPEGRRAGAPRRRGHDRLPAEPRPQLDRGEDHVRGG